MKVASFKIVFIILALNAFPSKQVALGSKASSTSAAMSILSRCPQSKCLTDAVSCLAGAQYSNANNSDQAKKVEKLEKEVANLKAELAKAGKPSGFAMLDSNGRLPHSLLDAGYDKYSAYDLAWQSLHMAAAAACRGSTASGGSGSWDNQVMTRNTADKKTCAWICAQTAFRNCHAEVSIYGKKGKATQNGMTVSWFYNYGCNYAANGGSEASSSDETVWNKGYSYFSFCCCRK
ncbi:unnamed protein product [Porites lobata]|uniref:Uncharacterized protein n=1 Tax=Porites lobata TaxID=104759 RepID=A0ABN8MWP9_9CNID|nr:unnamed protein product [Porites lobata]